MCWCACFAIFLNIAPGRIGSILSDANVNYKQVGLGRLSQSLVDAFSRDNLFQENKFERSSVRLRRVVVNGHSFLGLALDFSNFAVAVAKWAKRTLNSRFCPCATMVTNGYWSSMCAQLPRFLIYFFSFFFFFFFICEQEISSLVVSFSVHRA